jgi:DNA-binding response OmpR family regulator
MTPHKLRILFVEDHDDTCELIAFVLQNSHYEVATTATMNETLKLVRNENFNLFIFDAWLPDGTGLDLCKQVRLFDLRTPILFYSGLAHEKDRNLALRAGAQGYLIKPVEIDELLETVNELMSAQVKPMQDFMR